MKGFMIQVSSWEQFHDIQCEKPNTLVLRSDDNNMQRTSNGQHVWNKPSPVLGLLSRCHCTLGGLGTAHFIILSGRGSRRIEICLKDVMWRSFESRVGEAQQKQQVVPSSVKQQFFNSTFCQLNQVFEVFEYQ